MGTLKQLAPLFWIVQLKFPIRKSSWGFNCTECIVNVDWSRDCPLNPMLQALLDVNFCNLLTNSEMWPSNPLVSLTWFPLCKRSLKAFSPLLSQYLLFTHALLLLGHPNPVFSCIVLRCSLWLSEVCILFEAQLNTEVTFNWAHVSHFKFPEILFDWAN